MAALPFLPHVRLKGIRSKPKPYRENLQTLGEHIKRTRVERGQTQAQAREAIGVNAYTVLNWERGHTEPPVLATPAIIAFLGYDPFPAPVTLADRMLAKRRAMGWTIKEAAHRFGVDEATWSVWEQSHKVPWPRYRNGLNAFLEIATGG